jgi:ribosome-associated protein
MKETRDSRPAFDWQTGLIPECEVQISATRSGGPGGQSVNTTNSKVEVRWKVGDSLVLSDEQKVTVRVFARNRINRADELVIKSETERSQKQNKEEALAKLTALVRDALTPEEERIPTRKPKGVKAKERRTQEADRRRKAGRGKITDW